MNNIKNICVIGSGFAGISAATYLASEGHNVYVLEKNSKVGGRARKFTAKGYTFDMGPSCVLCTAVPINEFKVT